jgi:hypothetical protein
VTVIACTVAWIVTVSDSKALPDEVERGTAEDVVETAADADDMVILLSMG